MRDRITEELALLRWNYGEDVEYREAGDWFLIPHYRLPSTCTPQVAAVCFALRPGYPGIEPYGFYVAADVRCNGAIVNGGNPPAPPPFPGNWRFISWQPEGWVATADVVTGANLWGWARSFAARLREGP